MFTVDELLEQHDRVTVEAERRATCGIEQVDRITGGFSRGRVWVVTGTPGQGRTTLLTQWAAALAGVGWATRLICPREPQHAVSSRLLSCAGHLPLLHLHQRRVQDQERYEAVRERLRRTPLHVATQGESTFLDYGDEADSLPRPDAVVIDDADLIAGAFPERVMALAQRGALLIVSLPRHLVVHDHRSHQHLDPQWAAVADVVIEVRQAQWPDTEGPRPGEADLHVLRNRWGPTMTVSVVFQGHYARFVDPA